MTELEMEILQTLGKLNQENFVKAIDYLKGISDNPESCAADPLSDDAA
jgi:hypothetical protein